MKQGPYSVKQVLNSVKQGQNSARTSQTAVRTSITVYNQPGTSITGCVLLPLGSPTRVRNWVYEQSVPACRTCVAGGYQGGYTGWGMGLGGYQGRVIPVHPAPREDQLHDSEAGPGRPAGPGVGGHVAGDACPAPTLRARSVQHAGPPWCRTRSQCRIRPSKPSKPQNSVIFQ